MPVPQNEKARRALPFAAGFPLVAYLRYYRGDRNYFFKRCWKPARALPFACELPTYRRPRGCRSFNVQTKFSLSTTSIALSPGVYRLCGFSFPAAAASTGATSNASVSSGSRSPPATAVSNSLT